MCAFCWKPRDLVLHNYYRHLVSCSDLSRDFTDSWLNYFVFSPSCQNGHQLTPDCTIVAQGCNNVIQRWYRGNTEVTQGHTEMKSNCQLPRFKLHPQCDVFFSRDAVPILYVTTCSFIPVNTFFINPVNNFFSQHFLIFLLALSPKYTHFLDMRRQTKVVLVFWIFEIWGEYSVSKSVSVQAKCLSHIVRFLSF